MASMPTNQGSGDNDELQALFDSVVSGAAKAKAAAPELAPSAGQDSDELQALFDSVAASASKPPVIEVCEREPSLSCEARQEQVFNKIGQMTRLLHDSLRDIGFDRKLEETAKQIPDARERLTFIATTTEKAASRVLNATDIAQPIQDGLESGAQVLNARWGKLYAKELTVDEFRDLAGETHRFLARVADDSRQTSAQLLEIMMAQDFQDLTGQVIKKIVDMVACLEAELLRVLLEVMPDSKRHVTDDGLLNGPVINPHSDDVVTSQAQVDDLLESLGF